MQSVKTEDLAARLEQAHRLTHTQRTELLRDVERYAARDLYGAARLCNDHLSKQADLRMPSVVQVAPLLVKHFEARMHEQRRAIDLHHEQDRQMRHPEPGRNYVGPVVGTTPNCVVQVDKDTGDFIIHPRSSLVCAFESSEKDRDLSIHYPNAAIGGVGLVTRTQEGHGMTQEHGLGYDAGTPKASQQLEHSR